MDVRVQDNPDVLLHGTIERPLQYDGTICFGGAWVKPEKLVDGTYYMSTTLPKPTTPAAQRNNTNLLKWFNMMGFLVGGRVTTPAEVERGPNGLQESLL